MIDESENQELQLNALKLSVLVCIVACPHHIFGGIDEKCVPSYVVCLMCSSDKEFATNVGMAK